MVMNERATPSPLVYSNSSDQEIFQWNHRKSDNGWTPSTGYTKHFGQTYYSAGNRLCVLPPIPTRVVNG